MIVIAAIIVAAALAGIAFYLSQRGPTPTPATLDHVTVSAAQSSIDQVGKTTVTARAIDSAGVDQTANATFSWSASPSAAVNLTVSGVPFTITVQGIQGGSVTLSGSASWRGTTKIGTASLTVQALHFQLVPSTSAPLIGQPFILTARALYANNTLATGYAGTVHLASDDPTAALPLTDKTFTPGTGTYVFSDIIINKSGTVHITIVDTIAPTLTGSVTLTGNHAPVASFTLTSNSADPRQISVDGTGSSDPDGNPLTYAWSFGDSGTASGSTATHTYTNTFEQTYTVQLVVADSYGATNTATKQHIALVPPTASYAVEKENASGSGVYVQVNASTSTSQNVAGVLTSYDWTWGDGASSTVAVKVTYHVYSSAYNNVQVALALTVHDNYSLSGSVSKNVLVTAAAVPPVAAFTQSINNDTRTVSVDGSGSQSPIGRTIVAYNWTWGDGSWSGNLTVASASHTYASDANFTITLKVWDSGTPSLSGSASRIAWVQQPPLPPWVFFSAMRTLMHVAVDASATTDPNNNIATYAWNWGDGSTESHAVPTAAHDYTTSGAKLITLTVTDATNLHNSTAHYVSVATSTLDYRYYDFFNVPYGQWWDYRTTIGTYGDIPPDTNCFNATSGTTLVSGAPLCVTNANPNLPAAETYPYTNWYPLPGNVRWNNPGNDPLIYAPYRFNATGVDVPGYNLSEPVYLPVRNYAAPIGKQLTVNWYLQYIDSPTDQALRSEGCGVPDSSLANSGFDGFVLWNRINITTDLAESKRIFGIPLNYTAGNAQQWWNANTKPGYANSGALETWLGGKNGWFDSEGNGKYDVFTSFQWFYTSYCTEIVGNVDPNTGTTHVYISHAAWATEVLLARWFYWGNASYAKYFMDSTKARGWWGMELAWFEDMHFNAALDANGMNFSLDTVMQYHFEAGSFPGADGKYRTQTGEANPPDDVPFWTWWPVLTDYITSGKHPSELSRYAGQNYIHSTAGAGNYAQNVSFDYVPITWNLKVGQTWSFGLPKGNVVFYNPNTSPIPSNPQGQLVRTVAPLKYNFTFPGSLGGIALWNATTNMWDVFGPTNTGGPDSSGPGKYPLPWPYPSIFFTPDPPGPAGTDGSGPAGFKGSSPTGSLLGMGGFVADWARVLVAVPLGARSEMGSMG